MQNNCKYDKVLSLIIILMTISEGRETSLEVSCEEQASQKLFYEAAEKTESRNWLLTAGVGMAGLAGAVVYARIGTNLGEMTQHVSGWLDAKFTPEPRVIPNIVDGFVAVNEGLRKVALPTIALGGIATAKVIRDASKGSPRNQTRTMLAKSDYSGVDALAADEYLADANTKRKLRARISHFGAGAGVAALTVLLTGGTSGVENEISNGPLRPIERIFDDLAEDNGPRYILAQSQNITFMGDSYLNRAKTDQLARSAASKGVSVVPFIKALPDIGDRTGLVIAVPDKVFAAQTGLEYDAGCERPPILLDEANNAAIGETVKVNNADLEVAAKINGTAQMNRDVGIVPESVYEKCVMSEKDTPYFGAIVSGHQAQAVVKELINSSNFDNPPVFMSEEKFEANNKEFWRKNGTPILLQMIGYIGAMGAFAIGSERRGTLQRNVREIGTLNALGVPMSEIKNIERRRVLLEAGKATAIAAPLMPLMAAAFNMAEVGLKVGIGIKEMAVGYTVTLAAKLFGSRRSFRRFQKNLSLSDAVKG